MSISPTDLALTRFTKWISLAGLHEKEYQKQGVQNMFQLETATEPMYGCRGGFLTDEMGLGKTIQMLGLILVNPTQRTLIVVPPLLLDQWENAFIVFLGHHPAVYHGNRKKDVDMDKARVVITTYGTMSLRNTSGGEIISPLAGIKWDRIIYDEAHHMRNPNTGAFKGAEKLKGNIQWFVTGTPIQNARSDVFSLLKLFGIPKDVYSTAEGLSTISEHFKIGRTKAEVGIELEPVKIHDIPVQWALDEELNIAADLHSTLSFSSVSASNVDALISALTHHPLPALLRMRQSCIHMGMLKEASSGLIHSGVLKREDVSRGIVGSSKIDTVLKKIQENKDNGNNKIIFTNFRTETDILVERIAEMGLNVTFIDGRTPERERESILTATFDVLILQIQSSCEGLNLQQYNEVHFVSPHWNPAVEDQAIARAHRVGQTKPVQVYKYYMEGFGDESQSIDQYCMRIQEVKRMIALSF